MATFRPPRSVPRPPRLSMLAAAVALCLVSWDPRPRAIPEGPRPAVPDVPPPRLALPAEDDFSAGSLRSLQERLLAHYGGDHRAVPLDVKAAFHEQVLVHYHLAPWNQVFPRVGLPEEPGRPPRYLYGADLSTWNGALLAALSYKYAVTKDPQTLALIGRLLDGLHLYQAVTGAPGLAARCVLRSDAPIQDATLRYEAPDGTVYHYRSDPAKGTYNQLVGGYAVMMMLVYDDLPPGRQARARHDLQALAWHLVEHKYRLTEADGSRTSYGNLTPRLGTLNVPFNAQVAYTIVAAGHHFPGDNRRRQARIDREFERLRDKHRVYYESPWRSLVCPQHVGGSPFVKGMNDRNHVHNAAYVGLMLELDAARRAQRPPDKRFLYELGQTMYWTMEFIEGHGNALCNFMWAGLLRDPEVFRRIVPHRRDHTRRQLATVLATGFEQLRRFPVDRFQRPGDFVSAAEPQWVDTRMPNDSYFWKSDPFTRWQPTGPATNLHTASIDYLHAYWLMRYFRLDEPAAPP